MPSVRLVAAAALGSLLGVAPFLRCAESAWHQLDTGAFAFSAPLDVVAKPLDGVAIDSYVGEYRGTSLDVMFDYGLYSSPLGGYTTSHTEKINGREARLVQYDASPKGSFRFEHFRAVYFATTGEPKMRLTMFVSCRDDHACHIAEAMFRTIRFR